MAESGLNTVDDITATLQAERTRAHRKKWILGILVFASTMIAVVGWFYFKAGANNSVQYKTEPTKRGDLTVTVSATGVLEPVVQVDVGTEISGTVEKVAVDFNQRVIKGQILASLNTDQLEAKQRQSNAALLLAKSKVAEMQATLLETETKLARARELKDKNLYSQEDLDSLTAAHARAKALLDNAKAQVSQAQAQLDVDTSNLKKAVIRSPIDGIVLKRQVEPGQTVAASLQTPVLFVLAESLSQMELHVAVDEADVGKIQEGQSAIFTVDAYTDREFPARISQIRFAPQTVEGVVTYETVLQVDNSDLALRPGMTSTAEITVNVIKNSLLIPNAALRFSPPKTNGSRQSKGLVASLFSRRPQSSGDSKRKDLEKSAARHRVWVLQDGEPLAIPITIGESDGKYTQLIKGEIEADTALVIDVMRSGKNN